MTDEWFPYVALAATVLPVMVITYLLAGDPSYSLLSAVFVMVGLREVREINE